MSVPSGRSGGISQAELLSLLARPTATLSVEGQEYKEARERHYSK